MANKILAAYGFAVLLTVAPYSSSATPVHLETEAAHIIVVRPIDTWAGNRSTAEYTLDEIRKKKISFYYYDDDGNKIPGSGGFFKKPPQTPVVVRIQEGLRRFGFTNNGPSGMTFIVERPAELSFKNIESFTSLQNNLYKEFVVGQGDPATLSDRIMAKKFVSAGISLAVLGVGMDKLGAVSGSQFVFSTGIADDITKLTLNERTALAAVPAPVFDYSPYKAVQVRRITFGADRVGQIIIAYKGDKTAEAEATALAAGIVAASGADTTPEAIAAAREADYQGRLQIWAECVARAKCPRN
jgi:hypothetical protein